MITSSEVFQFMRDLPETVLVVFDEAYYEYVTNPDYPKSMHYFQEKRNVIILRTFSKIYGLAGTRVGYGFTSNEIVDNLNRIRPPFNVNRLAQVAALASLDDKEHVKKSIDSNRRGKDFIYSEFRKMNIPYLETEGNFILVDCQIDGNMVNTKLLQQGIIVRPMGMYNLPNHLRVTIGTEEQNQRFITAFKNALMN
jgi:histidinol-phosphate aminotransferase